MSLLSYFANNNLQWNLLFVFVTFPYNLKS